MSKTPAIAFLVFERDGYTCLYCERGLDDGVQLTVDHLTPTTWFERGTATGDPDDPGNLVCACLNCNSSKRDMDFTLYLDYLQRGIGWPSEDIAALRRRVRSALRRALPE